MQKYDFTAPANGASQTVNAPGRYVKYTVGNAGGNDAGLIITPGSKPGSKILLYPGQSFTLPESVAQPNGWTIANAVGQATITGTLVIGEGRLDDNTLSGVVQVVDGGKSRTIANSAFAGAFGSASDATHYPQVQLWNPAGSGIRLVIEFLTAYNATASNAYVQDSTAALATLVEQGQPKLLGGVAAVGQLRSGSTTVAPGVPDLVSMSIVAGQTQSWTPKEPVVVPPGHGLQLTGNVLNTILTSNIEWYEEPNV